MCVFATIEAESIDEAEKLIQKRIDNIPGFVVEEPHGYDNYHNRCYYLPPVKYSNEEFEDLE